MLYQRVAEGSRNGAGGIGRIQELGVLSNIDLVLADSVYIADGSQPGAFRIVAGVPHGILLLANADRYSEMDCRRRHIILSGHGCRLMTSGGLDEFLFLMRPKSPSANLGQN